MSSTTFRDLDEQIDRLFAGITLTENEVKVLCEKVYIYIVTLTHTQTHFTLLFVQTINMHTHTLISSSSTTTCCCSYRQKKF